MPTPLTSSSFRAVSTEATRPPVETSAQLTSVTAQIADDRHDLHDRDVPSERQEERRVPPAAPGQRRHEHRKARGECRERAGGRDEEARPSVQEAPEAPVCLSDEDVLAAGAREDRRQLGVREGPEQAHQPGDRPTRR